MYNPSTRPQKEGMQEEEEEEWEMKVKKEEEEKDSWKESWAEGGVAGDSLRSLVVARRLAKDWPRLKDAAPPTLKDWEGKNNKDEKDTPFEGILLVFFLIYREQSNPLPFLGYWRGR